MARWWLGLMALGTLVSTAPAQERGVAGAFGWRGDYAAARAEAQRTGKPIFLVFRCEP